MTGLRLELANPATHESPREYIEKHLAPVATELHQLVNEFLAPGSSSAEAAAVDMMPSGSKPGVWWHVDKLVKPEPKSVFFDGRDYFTMPAETLRAKRVKVQLSATVYVQGEGAAHFRLIRGDGVAIPASEFSAESAEPVTITRILPFGEEDGCVSPTWQVYLMQAKRSVTTSVPVCRRFSLSFLLI